MENDIMLFKPKNYVPQALLAIAIGLILIIWPDTALRWVVVVSGILLIISGIYSIVSYYTSKQRENAPSRMLLANGVIVLLFGIVLCISPLFFINFLMVLLGLLLVIGSAAQLWTLGIARRAAGAIPGILFIVPLLLLIAGLVIVFNPFSSARVATIMFGISALVFGAIQLYNAYVVTGYLKQAGNASRKEAAKPAEEIQEAEEVQEPEA